MCHNLINRREFQTPDMVSPMIELMCNVCHGWYDNAQMCVQVVLGTHVQRAGDKVRIAVCEECV